MKLFTVGPVNLFESTKLIGGSDVPYFRNDSFSSVMEENKTLALKLLKAPEGSELLTLTNSGTGAMEATIMNVCDDDSKILVINGGSFGERFKQLCDIHQLNYTVLNIKYDEDLTDDLLKPYLHIGINCLLVNLHETSIGKLYDSSVIHRFKVATNCLLVVDAISTFLADPYDMNEIGADVTIISSQKGLALPPGISLVALSPRALDVVKCRQIESMYFDFNLAIKNNLHYQTPFTPAVSLILMLNDRLKMIEKSGLEVELQRPAELAAYFRELLKIKNLPFDIPSFNKSNCLTPINLRNHEAIQLKDFLESKYSLYITPCAGLYHDSHLRVGHIGNLTIADIDELINRMEEFYK